MEVIRNVSLPGAPLMTSRNQNLAAALLGGYLVAILAIPAAFGLF